MPKRLGKDIVVFRSGYVVDAFYGHMGWNNHVRYVIRRDGGNATMHQVSKGRVPLGVHKSICAEVKL